MNELRDLVIEAHGGLQRWNQVDTIEGSMSITGYLWERKGWPDALRDVHVTVKTKTQWSSYRPFLAAGQRSLHEFDRTRIETLEGEIIKERQDPRSVFHDHTPRTPWDDLNLAYFCGYAMWNYLTTPFVFSWPGVQCEELEPRTENGETQRRLRVIFPDTLATHSNEQTFYINREGLVSRLDYNAAVTGNVPTAHFIDEYMTSGGIKFATKRRAFPRNPDGTPFPGPPGVNIAIADIKVS